MSQLKITQVKSEIGQTDRQRGTLHGLGLRRVGHTVVRKDTKEIRGMVRAIPHLVRYEEVQDGQ